MRTAGVCPVAPKTFWGKVIAEVTGQISEVGTVKGKAGGVPFWAEWLLEAKETAPSSKALATVVGELPLALAGPGLAKVSVLIIYVGELSLTGEVDDLAPGRGSVRHFFAKMDSEESELSRDDVF